MMKKSLFNCLFFAVFPIAAFAQTEGYHFYANIDTVKNSGFYNIVLSPQINVHLKTDYSDVRILDNKDKWVPHKFHSPFNEMNSEAVVADLQFGITESNKTNTILLVDAKQPLNNIIMRIKNTEVQKFCTLSGSNDKQNWFVIRDSVLLTPQPAEKSTESNIEINFPESNYSTLKLVINNRNKDPLNILSVSTNSFPIGFSFSNFLDSTFNNPATILLQKDSGKNSYIKIIQPKHFHFNQIDIKVEGLKYFNRQVDMYAAKNNNSSFSNPGKFINSFNISNNISGPVNLPLLNTNTLYFTIHNDDNPPLQFKKISTALSYRYITAYLESNNNYKIIMDNADAVLPNYDITKEYPTIKDSVPVVAIGDIFAYQSKDEANNNSFDRKWIIWISIIAALGLLLFFTKTMLKEVNKKNIHDNI